MGLLRAFAPKSHLARPRMKTMDGVGARRRLPHIRRYERNFLVIFPGLAVWLRLAEDLYVYDFRLARLSLLIVRSP